MKLSTSIFIGILSLFVSLTSCGRGQQHTQSVDTILERDSIDFNFPVTVEYAHGFTVANHPGYKELVMYKPGTRDTVADYILYPRSSEQPRVAHPQAVYIPVPARNLATSSSPHVGAVAVLGLQHVLVAVSDPEKVNDSLTRHRIQEGKVQRIGRGMSKDIERIIALNPDIYLQDLYSATEKDTDLVASGINILYFNNWKEQDLLGRAEWLKVIGLLYGRNAVADSAFRQMETSYQAAAQQAKGTSQIVPVMYGLDYKGVWYVPGEYSYIVKAFSDASISCDFIPGQIDSRPSSFEYVFRRNQHKKIWLCLMTGKLEKLSDFLALNERYIHFDAAREGEVWVDRKVLNQEGGNDFWESGPYHPDLVLKDFIKIAHPELLPGYETGYWMRLR